MPITSNSNKAISTPGQISTMPSANSKILITNNQATPGKCLIAVSGQEFRAELSKGTTVFEYKFTQDGKFTNEGNQDLDIAFS